MGKEYKFIEITAREAEDADGILNSHADDGWKVKEIRFWGPSEMNDFPGANILLERRTI